MIRRPPRSTHCISSAASDVYKRQSQSRPRPRDPHRSLSLPRDRQSSLGAVPFCSSSSVESLRPRAPKQRLAAGCTMCANTCVAVTQIKIDPNDCDFGAPLTFHLTFDALRPLQNVQWHFSYARDIVGAPDDVVELHRAAPADLSLIHISEPTRLLSISYAVFCLKKKTR